MSYTVIKSMGIRNGKVYLTAAESNVRPIIYRRYEVPLYTKILHEKGKDAVLASLLIHTVADGDIFLVGSKLGELCYFMFERWSGRHFLTELNLRKRDDESKAIDYLTAKMPDLLSEFKNALSEEEMCLILINGEVVTRTTPRRDYYHPGEGRVQVYTTPLTRYPWDPDFKRLVNRYKTFPNRFEAEYFATQRIGFRYRTMEILSEKGLKLIVHQTKPINWEYVEEVFRRCKHRKDVMANLYHCFLGNDWSRAEKINGWLRINPEDYYRLSKMFVEFDRKHHSDAILNGPESEMDPEFFPDPLVPKGYVKLSGCEMKFPVQNAFVRQGQRSDRNLCQASL